MAAAATALLGDLMADNGAAEAAEDRSATAVRDRIADQRAAHATENRAGVLAALARRVRSSGPRHQRKCDQRRKGGQGEGFTHDCRLDLCGPGYTTPGTVSGCRRGFKCDILRGRRPARRP